MTITWKGSEREVCWAWCVCALLCCVAPGSTGGRGGGLRGAKKHTIYREIQKFKALKRIKHAEYIPDRVLYVYMSMGVKGGSFPLSLRALFLRSSGLRLSNDATRKVHVCIVYNRRFRIEPGELEMGAFSFRDIHIHFKNRKCTIQK